MSITRQATNEVIELAEEGILSWEQVAMACLSYMSEDEVREMGEFNDFLFEEEDEDDE
jgi:hypothetical protein